MVTNYLEVGGQLLGQSSNGSRSDYLVDAVGSVVATVSSVGALSSTLTFQPYGRIEASSGSLPDYQWRGATAARPLEFGTLAMGGIVDSTTGAWTVSSGQGDHFGSYSIGGRSLFKSVGHCGDPSAPWKLMQPTSVYIDDYLICTTDCGNVSFVTFWALPSGTKGPGSIIQHPKAHHRNIYCKKPVTNEKRFNYIESWHVSAAGAIENGGFDTYNQMTDDSPCWKGTYSADGFVGFYPCILDASDSAAGWKPIPFTFTYCFPASGQVLYWGFDNFGAPWQFIDGPSHKSLSYAYDCCVDKPGCLGLAMFSPELPVFELAPECHGWSGKVTSCSCP